MNDKFILCFSGGKDSTAMLIHLLENEKPIDEILYVDVGDWIWKSAKTHIQQVKDKLLKGLEYGCQRYGKNN